MSARHPFCRFQVRFDPCLGVLRCVGVWDAVAEVVPDLHVVCVVCQRVDIREAVAAHGDVLWEGDDYIGRTVLGLSSHNGRHVDFGFGNLSFLLQLRQICCLFYIQDIFLDYSSVRLRDIYSPYQLTHQLLTHVCGFDGELQCYVPLIIDQDPPSNP